MNLNAKHLFAAALVGLLFVAGNAMAADTTTASQSNTRIVPVLVAVDSHGNITEMDPAPQLTPGLRHLLRQTLDQMINQPAHDTNGKPIPSQFVINLSMQATQLANGQYKAKFTYVSMQKVGIGNWHWSHSGHMRQKLALVNSNGAVVAQIAQKRRRQMNAARAAKREAVYEANHPQSGNGHSH